MKILKKLLPLATLASTAMVAAPFVASCSKNITISSLDWKPSSQHKAETITMGSDLTQYKQLSKDYFEADNNKHFKEDICYTEVDQIKIYLDELKKETGVSDANVVFSVTVSDLSLVAQDAKIGDITFPGYKASFKINIDSIFTWKQTQQIKSGGVDRIENENKTIASTIETVTDFFTYLAPVSTPSNLFRYRVCSYDDNNWKDVIDVDSQAIVYSKYVYDGGNTHYVTTSVTDSYSDEYTKSKVTQKDVISDKSYYLANVTHN